MSPDVFSLSLTNLALDGSLDPFIDLYKFTYNAYLTVFQETPSLSSDRDHWNCILILNLLPEFESFANGYLEVFTTKVKNVHLQPQHFKYFDFFDEDKIHKFEWWKRFNLDQINRGYDPFDEQYTKSGNEEFELRETAIELQDFVNLFQGIVAQAIRDEIQKDIPSYTIFDAKRDVETHIKEHMKLRRKECVISNDTGISPTTEPLHIYDALNNTACKLSRHQVMLRKYYAKHIDGKRLVVLPVHYCETCNRYMIGSLSLSLFREFCGKFLMSTIGVGTDGSREWKLQGESKLHRLGYNVVVGQLSPTERKNILISIVESKQLTSFEVIATIEQDIRIFENNKRMQNAVEKWRSDLQFINEYMISKK